jgi:hypothetical protein
LVTQCQQVLLVGCFELLSCLALLRLGCEATPPLLCVCCVAELNLEQTQALFVTTSAVNLLLLLLLCAYTL